MHEVAVIGGGPAGAAAALMLTRRGRRVVMIDRVDPNHAGAFKAGEGLPPAARPLLRDLGALEPFLQNGHLPSYGNEASWGAETTTVHDFIRDPNGHGWHLDRVRFDALLRQLALEAGAELRTSTRLQGLDRDAGTWRLTVESAGQRSEIHAAWLVDATGRAAHVAHRLGATTVQEDRQVAFSALFTPEPEAATEDRDSLTLVESAPDGWWYTALLPGQRRVVAFLTDSDLPAARAAVHGAGFDDLLEQTRHVRARLTACGHRRITGPCGGPAAGSRLTPGHGDGWVAVGDAALAFDPLSSQGMLTALYGGLRTADAIAAELQGAHGSVAHFGKDFDDIQAAYRRHRRDFYAEERRWPEREFWRRRH